MVLAASQPFPSLRHMLAEVCSGRELKLRLQWIDGSGGVQLDSAVQGQPKGPAV